MSRFTESACIVVLVAAVVGNAVAAPATAKTYPDIGRSATPAEIQAWDIDVRPDFKGLPAGSGSVARGQQIWETKCESCHGVFGESNSVFTPIAGGTNVEDIKAGRVASLKRPDFPQRTSLMKLSQVSTLWDYIRRAMPWNAPKSLSTDEVYAVTAYVLNLGDIVPADFVLSDRNIGEVQARLPNRNGMRPFALMWDVRGKADVRNARCMKNCPQEMEHMSSIPDYARNQHGNLAEQNRHIGPARGTDTAQAASPATAAGPTPSALAQKYACSACHMSDRQLVGPSHAEIAARYRDKPEAEAMLMAKVRAGGTGVWGTNIMPPHNDMDEKELRALVRWSLSGGN